MTEAEVHTALVRWVAGITAVPAIKAHSDARRPAKPYVMVNRMLSGPVHEHRIDDEFTVANAGLATETISQHPVRDWYWRFSLHAYANQAPDSLLRKVHVAFDVPTHHLLSVHLHPLHIHEVSAIRHVPDVVENAVENRANMDIELRGIVRDGLVIDVIEQTSFTASRV
jgi:hypothetical protein